MFGREVWLAVVVVVAMGCGGRKGAANRAEAPAPSTPAEIAEILLGTLQGMQVAIEARCGATAEGAAPCSATACSALAGDLEQLFARARPSFERARAYQVSSPEAGELAAELRARQAGVASLEVSIGRGLERCKGNAELVQAIQRMPIL